MRAGTMRHRVNVLRPTKTTGDYDGQRQGKPDTILSDVPCSIETLSGREAEIARQVVPIATHRVRMYGDPKKPLQYADFLQFGTRRLEIGAIIDAQQNGIDLELLCGEITD